MVLIWLVIVDNGLRPVYLVSDQLGSEQSHAASKTPAHYRKPHRGDSPPTRNARVLLIILAASLAVSGAGTTKKFAGSAWSAAEIFRLRFPLFAFCNSLAF